MARTLKVELTTPKPLSVQWLVSDFQDFGEDVYRALQDECTISLEEIDHFTGAFHLRDIPKRNVRTVTAKVRKILEKHDRLKDVKIDEITDDTA